MERAWRACIRNQRRERGRGDDLLEPRLSVSGDAR
jgi:hypothetical protein